MKCLFRPSACLFLLLAGLYAKAQNDKAVALKGIVLDQQGQAIRLANVFLDEISISTFTDEAGKFMLYVPSYLDQISLRVTYVGKKAVTTILPKSAFGKQFTIVLKDNSLSLDSIVVHSTYANSSRSISSIVFDEEAIERVQAFSLMDVLNTLPGKQMAPPDINAPQTLTLRTTLSGSHATNNSLGIPIIVDGVTLSNDANMQSRLVGQRGMSGALPATLGGNTADVPFKGIDLRELPVESIERIEVIQGVASAEYGELTDGAIIIERKAGRTPWLLTTNMNGGSRNYSLDKGFNIGKRWGGLTMGANYAISNSNPQDKVQEYKRYGLSVRWNTAQLGGFRNKLSVDFSYRRDDARLDPDDDAMRTYFSTESGVRISNNTSVALRSKLADEMTLTLAYSERVQDSYAQTLMNRGSIAVGGKDTTGIYEGLVLSGRYMAVEQIIGNPLSFSGSLKFTRRFRWGKTGHNLSYGWNTNYSNNGGKGILEDPQRPRFLDIGSQNTRPYSFELTPSIINTGVYVSDNFRFNWQGRMVNSNFGVRFDSQAGSWSIQPRLSTQITLNSRWNIGLAYGISSKAPTLLHRHPPPTWIDVPLIFAQNSKASLYLLYTQKVQTANEGLRPMRSSQGELTVNYRHDWFSSRLNMYYKDNRNGFKSHQVFVPITVPEYVYSYDESLNRMIYEPSGTYRTYRDKGYQRIGNFANSYTYGVDWSLSAKQIPAIQTSFSTSTSFIVSRENNVDILDMVNLSSPVEINGENIWYGLYAPLTNDLRYALTSKLNTVTHIPKLGFVIMTNTDVFWSNKSLSLYRDEFQYASGYLDSFMQQVLVPVELAKELLPRRNLNLNGTEQRMVYANFSVSVAKEVGKKIRIAVTAYNTFNLLPQTSYFDADTGQDVIQSYNSPLSITGGISFKL